MRERTEGRTGDRVRAGGRGYQWQWCMGCMRERTGYRRQGDKVSVH